MTSQLPDHLLRLFIPRPALPFAPPLKADRDVVSTTNKGSKQSGNKRSRHRPVEGIALYAERVRQEAADRGEATEGAEGEEDTWTDAECVKLDKRRAAKKQKQEEYRREADANYDPSKDEKAKGDPFKTLFVSRLSYEVTEEELHKEFGVYGPIEHLRLVKDEEGKSRGYAFIVYEREKDMRTAYKDSDGLKIRGRRILVDVERGRTVKGWKPMRLGGGLGASQTTRKKKEPEVEAPPPAMGFGMRGGFRGGGRGGGFGMRGRGGFRGGPPGGGGFGGGRGGFGGPPRGGYGTPPSGPGMGAGPPRGYGGGAGGFGGPPPMGYGGPPRGGYGGGYSDGPAAKRGRY